MIDPIPGLDRRRFLRAASATGTLASTGLAAASHDDEAGYPLAGFSGTACDVDRTDDRYLPFDTDGAYGGWGGNEYHATDPGLPGGENPVVFVHGNTRDACDWSDHATRYLRRGYGGDQLWSITFENESPTHDEMARQLDDFVSNVLAYAGADTVDVVSHSLGVTGVRFWMADSDAFADIDERFDVGVGSRYDVVDTFVGCAGANEGTSTCGPGCEQGPGASRVCGFISPDCAEPGGPLHRLNDPDETPGDVDYYTLRGNLDYFYADNRDSPKLDGANANVVLSARAHNAARASEPAIEFIYQWVTDADPGRPDRATEVEAEGTHETDGSVYVGGGTARVGLSVDASGPVLLRDRVPYTADVYMERDESITAVAPRPHLGVREIYFEGPADGYDLEYLVGVPEESGSYEFGPAEIRSPDATQWAGVPDTTTEFYVVGGEL
jgi:pimeloyl-ACP methyl ester carboxylesterase